MTCLQIPSAPLPAAPQPPSLLPFHIAYSGPAPVSTYFLPRPAPVDPHAPSTEPLLLSTFRGRQVVGQHLRVPDGYSGVILSVPPPPPSSSVASRSGDHRTASTLLDPASLFNTPDVAPETAAEAGDAIRAGLRRSPRKRMASAAAVARPPPAKRARVAAKKFQLDSDSESDDERPAAVPAALGKEGEGTPSLVSVATALTTPSLSAGSVVTPLGSVAGEDEAVVAVAADTESADLVQEELEVAETVPLAGEPAAEAVLQLGAVIEPVASPPPRAQDEAEAFTPADEPYTADQLLPCASAAVAASDAARLITPLSSFDTIALWTADDPVDPGRDELYRCLGKGGWLEMSRLIHEEEHEEDD
jgi:hypothetical protein